MVDRSNKWDRLERGNPDLAELRNRDTTSYFSTFSEFNTGKNTTGDGVNFLGPKNMSMGEDIIKTLIRNLARELKLSPHEISKWSLSDIIYMYSDIISKNDIEIYTMIQTQKDIENKSNTKYL